MITIERHILEQQQRFPHARGTFTQLMYDVALWAKVIARKVQRGGLTDILGEAGTTNIQGEVQQKLDVFANQTIVQVMDHTGRLCIMASEEIEEPIPIPPDYPYGDYVILFDPLDGSSNVEYNIGTGTIFSIYQRVSEPGTPGTLADLLQPGVRQVAAGYVVYGSSTMMVYSAGEGVHGFTLDPTLGEFLLSHPNICIPAKPKYYSVNQGYETDWGEGVRRFVGWLTGSEPGAPHGALSQRYTGALVTDFHRTLLAGGIYMYPPSTENPAGKLRLCYECAPLGFIAEQAAGWASDGVNPVCNLKPDDLHQRAPFFVGNRDLVEKAEEYIRRYDQAWLADYQKQVTLVSTTKAFTKSNS